MWPLRFSSRASASGRKFSIITSRAGEIAISDSLSKLDRMGPFGDYMPARNRGVAGLAKSRPSRAPWRLGALAIREPPKRSDGRSSRARCPHCAKYRYVGKLPQKSRVLLQAFPKKSLAVLWNFKGLQGFQASFDVFQIFLLQPPLFGRILDAAGPHSAGSLGARPAARLISRCSPVDTWGHDPEERIFNLTDNPISGKKYP